MINRDLVLIRATYHFLINNYVNRPYIPGLLRLMVHALAVADQWGLLLELCCRAIHHKEPFLSSRNVAALVNYAISLSIKHNKGKKEIRSCTKLSV